jgi:hypothetical protein
MSAPASITTSLNERVERDKDGDHNQRRARRSGANAFRGVRANGS